MMKSMRCLIGWKNTNFENQRNSLQMRIDISVNICLIIQAVAKLIKYPINATLVKFVGIILLIVTLVNSIYFSFFLY